MKKILMNCLMYGDDVNMIVVQVLPGRVPSDVLPNVEEALRRIVM
jgi:hypothetical protein